MSPAPGFLIPTKGKFDEQGNATGDRNVERWVQGPGLTNSVVQEVAFSGVCGGQAVSSTGFLAINNAGAGFAMPAFSFNKYFQGTTVRIKFNISAFDSGTTSGFATYGCAVGSGANIQSPISRFYFNPLGTHMTQPATVFDVIATSNPFTNRIGTVPITFYVQVSVNTVTWQTDGNDWYSVIVSEIAP